MNQRQVLHAWRGSRPNSFRSSSFALRMASLRRAGRFRPARFSKNVNNDMAERNGDDFLRALRSALRLSERAIARGSSLNTPRWRSSASLRSVTWRDHRRVLREPVHVRADVRGLEGLCAMSLAYPGGSCASSDEGRTPATAGRSLRLRQRVGQAPPPQRPSCARAAVAERRHRRGSAARRRTSRWCVSRPG